MRSSATFPTGYRLVQTRSTGECASVYGAVREADGREVVLKVYTDASSQAQREYQAFQQVAGPGVPVCFELIEQPPSHTLVIDRVPSMHLASWVREAERSPSDVIQVALQLARILTRVHQAGLLHCDLTPANIMIEPETLEVHLIDFGLARRLGSPFQPTEVHSSINAVARGLHFIAPEQSGRMDRGIDYRSDLYTLGATLYYALTGTTMFDGRDALALVHAHMARVPVPPRERRPEVPEALSRLVMKLVEKEPDQR